MREIKAVCTKDEAREYFKNKGLTYSDVYEGDILVLVMLLNQEIKKAINNDKGVIQTLHLSRKMDIKKKTNGSIIRCFLYINADYFTRREAISFNKDGFIGFAGWADQSNVNPILRAFLKWCDYLSETKSEVEENA